MKHKYAFSFHIQKQQSPAIAVSAVVWPACVTVSCVICVNHPSCKHGQIQKVIFYFLSDRCLNYLMVPVTFEIILLLRSMSKLLRWNQNICRLTPFCLPFTLEGNEIFLSRFVITFLFQMKIETSKCEGFISWSECIWHPQNQRNHSYQVETEPKKAHSMQKK